MDIQIAIASVGTECPSSPLTRTVIFGAPFDSVSISTWTRGWVASLYSMTVWGAARTDGGASADIVAAEDKTGVSAESTVGDSGMAFLLYVHRVVVTGSIAGQKIVRVR